MTFKQLEAWARANRVSLTINYKVRAGVFWVQARQYKKSVVISRHADLGEAIDDVMQTLAREPGRLKR